MSLWVRGRVMCERVGGLGLWVRGWVSSCLMGERVGG